MDDFELEIHGHMVRPATDELKPGADDLLVFVDDTGHEALAGDHDYYGLGGCVVLASGYEYLKAKWREVRRAINGDPDLPLHGSRMERKPENFRTLADFFLDRSIVRVAVTTSRDVALPDGMHPCVPVMGQLQENIEVIASLLPCTSVWIIVESSQRADPIVKSCYSQLTPVGGESPIPITNCLMPKSSNEPGLEVADFIIGAAGSQAQRHLRGQNGMAADFRDVFSKLPAVGCWYSRLVKVAVDENGLVAVEGVRWNG